MVDPAAMSGERLRLPKLTIFCDGSNFLPSLREAGISYSVDIPRFARALAKQPPGYILNKLRYYTAPSPRPNVAQQRFFEILRQSPAVELVLGRHETRGGGAYHVEKETDVNLSVDMVVGAYEHQYDVAMLVSGDTDYVRAVQAVRLRGKRVVWCHFRGQQHSDQLRQACDETLELTDQFLRTCKRSVF